MNHDSILTDYSLNYPMFGELQTEVEDVLTRLLGERSLKFHSITSRIKSRQSLQSKINGDDANFQSLGDVDDVLGVRVVTLSEGSVEDIAKLIESLFDVDNERSYRSYGQSHHALNLVCRRPVPGSQYFDEKRNVTFEIQIQSLNH